MWAAMVAAAAAATITAVVVVVFERKVKEPDDAGSRGLQPFRKVRLTDACMPEPLRVTLQTIHPACTHMQDMVEREYLPLIPGAELRRIRAFIKRATTARGWLATPLQAEDAWQRALDAARAPRGGGWQDMFLSSDLQLHRLQQMADVLDEEFLGGLFGRLLQQQGKPPLDFQVHDEFAGVSDWISYFAETNTIHLLRKKWSQDVSDAHPMSCEGVLCSTRLQILAHTVAHEMVHALVFNLWPDIDRGSPAYLPCARHGPIFKLMNKRLFGHASDSYHHVFKLPPSGEGVLQLS